MIISASRRTDIPNYFTDWFLMRLKEKYVLVRNPMNPKQVSRVSLAPGDVDGIVFWTKNPLPMLDKLALLRDWAFYFQFTLTSCGTDAEPGIPSKSDVIIPAFRRLADRLGPDRVFWRYDPIFLSGRYTIDYHAEFFDKIAERLEGYTSGCTFSFMDDYRHIARRLQPLGVTAMTDGDKATLARHMAESARRHKISLAACAEDIVLDSYGVSRARCVDASVFEKILGRKLTVRKDRSQRLGCGCSASVDIGAYGTCPNGCLYCYANHSLNTVMNNIEKCDPASPLLCGAVAEGDRVTSRSVKTDMTDMFEQLRISEDV